MQIGLKVLTEIVLEPDALPKLKEIWTRKKFFKTNFDKQLLN